MLVDYSLLEDEQSREWKETVIKIITEKLVLKQNYLSSQNVIQLFFRYLDITSEVMENVKRTEDSLLKLKRNRRSIQVEPVNEGLSDDNKIRLQITIDIEAYAKEVSHVVECLLFCCCCLCFAYLQVKAVLPTGISSPFFQKLLDIASIAKTTATTN